MIHEGNYEIWFIDFLEGNLSEGELDVLRAFLVRNPELKEELEEMKQCMLTPPDYDFKAKSTLHKPFDALSLEEQIIAYLEGELDQADQEYIALRIRKEKDVRDLYLSYQKTYLSTTQIKYAGTDKTALYKSVCKAENIDDLILSDMDGSITADEHKWLYANLSLADIQRRKKTFAATCLTPDNNIVYPDKSRLKKRRSVLALWSLQALRIAASTILLIGAAWMLYNYGTTSISPQEHTGIAEIQHPEKQHKVVHETAIHPQPNTPEPVSHSQEPKDVAVHLEPAIPHTKQSTTIAQKKQHTAPSQNIAEPAASVLANANTFTHRSGQVNESFKDVIHRPEKMEVAPLLATLNVSNIVSVRKETLDLPPAILGNSFEDAPQEVLASLIDKVPVELEIPPAYTTVINSVARAGATYFKERAKKKSVIAFDLGPFSFYKSSQL